MRNYQANTTILVSFSTAILLALSLSACGDGGDSSGGPDAMPDAPSEPPFGSADDVTRAQQLWSDMGDYTTWSLMPGTAMFEPSQMPHGAFARIFINSIAETDPSNPAAGSIIVKQNYASDTEDDFDAVTVMYKLDGYAPDYGDWFWAKFTADGTLAENPAGVPMAGQIGRDGDTGCIPCHSSADGNDFIYKN